MHQVGRKIGTGWRNSTRIGKFARSVAHEKGDKTIKATHGLEDDKLVQKMKSNSGEGNGH